jgi:mannitol-1-/sugar-/sorbitol-6-phosphatase
MGEVAGNPVGARQLSSVERGRQGQAAHARTPRCSHAADGIFDDQALRWRQRQSPARLEKDVRRRLLVDHLGAVYDGVEPTLGHSDLVQVRDHFRPVGARRHGDGESAAPAIRYEFTGAGQRLKPAANHLFVDLVEARLVAGQIHRQAARLGGSADVPVLAHPDEGSEIIGGHDLTLLREECNGRFRQQRFRNRKHAIEIENDTTQLGAFHYEPQAIVFDLDGVLVDTMPSIRAAWTQWAIARNLAPADVLTSIHMTGVELVRHFAPEVDPVEEVRRISARQARSETVLARFEGSLELLELLPPEAWAIVTSARLEPAMRHLTMAGLPVPRVLITAELTPRGKPDPAGYRLAAARLGIEPGRCVAVEDSPGGIVAARAAGMITLGVTNTHEPHELGHANALISSLADLEVTPNPDRDQGRLSVRWRHWIEHDQD